MKILILGSTGMLGKSLIKEARRRKHEVIGIARKNTTICLDITQEEILQKALDQVNPDLIINTAALVDLIYCEKNPCLAYMTNARAVASLTELSRQNNIGMVQISTDHFYTGNKNGKHSEKHPVRLLNEYSITKYAGEQFALSYEKSLVIRTNIIGFRNDSSRPTFAEWIFSSLENKSSMVLFDDFFTSSIDVHSFSKILFDLIEKRIFGLLNVASREVVSKKEFIKSVAIKSGLKSNNTSVGSIFDMNSEGVHRCESLGLDVSNAETILSYKFPTLEEVVNNLVLEYKNQLLI